MKRPVWFHTSLRGGVPLHWTPIAWQGWAVIGVYLLAFGGGMSLYRAPALLLTVEASLVMLLIAIALRTDDRPR